MSNPMTPDPLDVSILDFESIADTAIEIQSDATAIALSQALPDPLLRWQSYLALLVLEGFKTWLQQQSSPIVTQQSTLLEPTGFDIPTVSYTRVNGFKVCCIAIANDEDERVEIPAQVIEQPHQAAHFYLAATVYPDHRQVVMRYFLRHDQLAQFESATCKTSQQTYELPTSIFETDFHQLLLYLTCLEPSAIVLPSRNTTAPLKQWLVQPVVNAQAWFQRQISEQINELAWQFFSPTPATRFLMSSSALAPQELKPDESLTVNLTEIERNGLQIPSPTPAISGMMDSPALAPQELKPDESLTAVLTEIERNGLQIPTAAKAAYQDIWVGDRPLRLSVVIWAQPQAQPEPTWSLLAILRAASSLVMLEDTRLILSEANTPIVSTQLAPGSAYLVTQAIGNWNEQFTLTIDLPTGESVTLPPFIFAPN